MKTKGDKTGEVEKIGEHFFHLPKPQITHLNLITSTDETIFLTGETGSGKTELAKYIHYNGPRQEKKVISISLSSIAGGLFESELFGHIKGAFTGAYTGHTGLFQTYNEGTIILEDITELPFKRQDKLLTFLDEGMIKRVGSSDTAQLDIRIIATTNQNVTEQVRKGLFREDLYFRLTTGFEFEMPSLNTIDVKFIDSMLCSEISKKRDKYSDLINGNGSPQFSKKALQIIKDNLSGNYRGIQKLANYLAFTKKTNFAPDDLPPQLFKNVKYTSGNKLQTIEEKMIEYMIDILEICGGNRTKTAEILGISTRTLRDKLNKKND